MSQLRWSLLKRISNSGYARLTVLVPIIGWLLLANDEIAKLISRALNQATIAQPSWKIYALHVGLSIFGIGVGLFYLICPYPINLFNSFTDFARTDRQTVTSAQVESYKTALRQAKLPEPEPVSDQSLVAPQTSSQDGRELWLRRNEDHVLDAQYRFYEMNDTKWRLWQVFVLIFIVPGAILTFIPSAITIAQSFKRLYVLIFG